MASSHKNLSQYRLNEVPEGKGKRIGIVVSDWNANITGGLQEACVDTLVKHGVLQEDITLIHVPGTFELTSGASLMSQTVRVDGIVCLGCVVKGETRHDEYINSAVAHGLTNLSLKVNKPVVFGVLTVENMYQAVDRAGGKHGNKGTEAAITVLKMVELFKTLGDS